MNIPESQQFNLAMMDKLKVYEATFLDIRQQMGLGQEIGFGLIPESQIPLALGNVQAILWEEGLRYRPFEYSLNVRGNLFREKGWVPFSEQNEGLMIVCPEFEKKGVYPLVSIYPKPAIWCKGAVDPRFLDAPDEVFVGLIAHELSHLAQLPESLRGLSVGSALDHVSKHALVDLIASSYGFKKEILAMLQYSVKYTKPYASEWEDVPYGPCPADYIKGFYRRQEIATLQL